MAFEDMDLEDNDFDLEPDETPPLEESPNRTFYIVAGVIGGVMLLSLICLALYALVIAPQRQDDQATQVALVNAQNTQVAIAAEETALAAKFTSTPTASALPDTGFAEDVGVPVMVGLALVLVVVIFLARRLRTTG